jgi:hypothetical protein
MAARQSASESIDLQKRDIALLRGLFECRIMTAEHVSSLYFDSKEPYTKKRLQKLKSAGFIGERKRRVNERAVLFLTRKAFSLLDRNGHLSGFPKLNATSFENRSIVSRMTIQHELEVMDVKAAFHKALGNDAKVSIREFSTWPVLNQFEIAHDGYSAPVPLKPDGYLQIHELEPAGPGDFYDCFLEIDRSSESQGRLVNKAVGYLNYYSSGEFAIRKGGTTADRDKFPFRVLMIFKTVERRNNTAEELLKNNPPILRLTWLSTLAEVTANPLGPIWILPKAYRELTTGTAFDIYRVRSAKVYRREVAREIFVESKIQKRRLLES